MANEDVILEGDPLTDKGMALDLTTSTNGDPFLDLNDFGALPTSTKIVSTGRWRRLQPKDGPPAPLTLIVKSPTH